jgi:RNA 3'-terminal phosphate cyclase (ATP)
MIEIDGSLGEGGGQILRTSLALAAVLGKELRIFNIRAGRAEPGLRAQHLTVVRALAQICDADSRGVEVGSTEFEFKPAGLKTGDFRFDVGTAGSVTLVLQSLLPLLPFAHAEIGLEIHGGTDVKWSPPVDYLRLVALPLLARMGVAVSIESVVRGHYPRGGGVVVLRSTPTGKLRSLTGQDRGAIVSICGMSHVSNLPRHIAERQAASAAGEIRNANLPLSEIIVDAGSDNRNQGAGSGIVIVAKSENRALLGADCLGEKGKPAEEIGKAAGKQLVDEIKTGNFLDRHMGDIIVPYMVLAEGISAVSVSKMTQHTLTNVRVAESITGVRFDPLAQLDQPGMLRVNGVGWQ